jgi:hypothetical protein
MAGLNLVVTDLLYRNMQFTRQLIHQAKLHISLHKIYSYVQITEGMEVADFVPKSVCILYEMGRDCRISVGKTKA